MVRAEVTTNERALLLGRVQPLVGVVTEPLGVTADRKPPAFIMSNSGLVHRVGPSRLYVTLARRLAARGHLVARIDHRGIGDSDPRRDDAPFHDAAIAEIRDVMDDLAARHGVERFVVLGICSGADVAIRTAMVDDRAVGAVMINGGGLSVSAELNREVLNKAWAREYVSRSLFSPGRWWRALTGHINYRHLASVMLRQVGSLRGGASEVQSAADAYASKIASLVDRGGRLLLLYSEDDDTLLIQKRLLGDRIDTLSQSDGFQLEILEDTDHTFTYLRNQRDLFSVIERWANGFASAEPRS